MSDADTRMVIAAMDRLWLYWSRLGIDVVSVFGGTGRNWKPVKWHGT